MRFNMSTSFVGKINDLVEGRGNTARMLLCRISSLVKNLGITTAH